MKTHYETSVKQRASQPLRLSERLAPGRCLVENPKKAENPRKDKLEPQSCLFEQMTNKINQELKVKKALDWSFSLNKHP